MPRHAVLAGVVLALVAVALPGRAAGALTVSSASAVPTRSAAGSHPDLTISLSVTGGRPKDLRLALPAGLVGDPRATARCTATDLVADACPAASAVGRVQVDARADLVLFQLPVAAPGDVYNLEPRPGEPARLGIVVRPLGALLGKFTLQSPVTVRTTSDFGLDASLSDLPTSLSGISVQIDSIALTLLGRPAGALRPFLTLPTACVPATTRIAVSSYETPTAFATRDASFTPTSCGAVPFEPALRVTPETTRADTPSGYSVALELPDAREGISQSALRRAQVVLPLGTALSPGVAPGLETCAPESFGLGTDAAPSCPGGSEVGTVRFDTPPLGTLTGSVFLAPVVRGEPFGLLLAAEGGGVRLKLRGEVRADPDTGRLTATFAGLPPIPFTAFRLTFRGGPTGLLVNPASCGAATSAAALEPYRDSPGASPTSRASAFTVDDDGAGATCPPARPFAPEATVEVASRQAGRPAGSLRLAVRRADRDERLRSLSLSLPPGLAANLTGVGLCAETELAAGVCPATSRVGRVAAEVGSGPAPVGLGGEAFLVAGRDPSEVAALAFVIPARVGPLDLGLVVLRAGLRLRATDGGIDVVTGDLPALRDGIPLAIRNLTVDLDRSGFATNATACSTRPVRIAVQGAAGGAVERTVPYRATGCADLRFTPVVRVRAGARGRTATGRRPPLTVGIRQPAGESALRRARVVLPPAFAPTSEALSSACVTPDPVFGSCPPSAQIGTARARTSLLPVPLTGRVEVVAPPGGVGLPLVRVTFGAPAPLVLTGGLTLNRSSAIVASFPNVPDVPLESFRLTFRGGPGGALQLTRSLCRGPALRLGSVLRAHSGPRVAGRSRVRATGCAPRRR